VLLAICVVDYVWVGKDKSGIKISPYKN